MKHVETAAVAILCGVALGCPKKEPPPSPPLSAPPGPVESPAASPSQTPATSPAPDPEKAAMPPGSAAPGKGSARSREEEEKCVDAWLAEHNLDRYGHPSGTMYTGGTPLFDERTGRSTDRLAYVYKKHPQARQACAGGGGE